MSKIYLSETDVIVPIDLQGDFSEDGNGDKDAPEFGALGVKGANYAFMKAIEHVVGKFRKARAKIVPTQDYHPKGHASFASTHNVAVFSLITLSYGEQVAWPDHCEEGTEGAEFHPGAAAIIRWADAIIRKGRNPLIDSYSGFFENDRVTPTGLDGYLKNLGIKRVFLCGLARNYCVGFTALDAIRLGYEVYLIEDLTLAIEDGSNDAMTELLIAAGVKFISSDDFA